MKVLLTAGAVAGAIGSIVGLPPAVGGLFDHPASTIGFRMLSATPMTFGTAREKVGGDRRHWTQTEQALRGALIYYDVETSHYHTGDELPMRWTVTDLKKQTVRHLPIVPMTITGEKHCTCHRWVPAPNRGDDYEVMLEMWPPGGGPTKNPTARMIRFTQKR